MDKIVRLFVLVLVVSLFGLSISHAQVVKKQDGVELEIGAGVAKAPGHIDALFKIEGQANIDINRNADGYVRFVIAKIDADFDTDFKNSDDIDIEFETVGYEQSFEDISGRLWWRASLLNGNFQRNLHINNSETMNISLVGINLGYENQLTEKVKLILEGALDLITLEAHSKRNSDGSKSKATGGDAAATAGVEVGLEIKEKYKITFGYKGTSVLTDPQTNYLGYGCQTYYDHYQHNYDYYYTVCGDMYSRNFTQSRSVNSFYVDLVANLTRRLSAFGQVAYNVYKVRDDLSLIPNSKDKALQFKLGAAYKF